MHKHYFNSKTVKTSKTIIFAPTCFGLHKPLSGSYSPRFAKVTILIAINKSLLGVFNIMTAYFVQCAIKGPELRYIRIS